VTAGSLEQSSERQGGKLFEKEVFPHFHRFIAPSEFSTIQPVEVWKTCGKAKITLQKNPKKAQKRNTMCK
jgi:hypothetical protein